MLVCKLWRRGVFLNNISLGIVLAEEKSLSWYFTFSRQCSEIAA